MERESTRMSKLHFVCQFTSFELSSLDLPIEVRKSNLALVARSRSSQTVELKPGIYHVTAKLPAGQELYNQVQVDEGTDATVVLSPDPEDESPNESRAVQHFLGSQLNTAQVSSPNQQQIIEERKPLPIAVTAGRTEIRSYVARLRAFQVNMLLGNYDTITYPWLSPSYPQQDMAQIDIFNVHAISILQLLQPKVPAINVVLPARVGKSCSLILALLPNGLYSIDIHLGNTSADLLMRYLQKGLLEEAALLTDSEQQLAEQLLNQKLNDPIAGAVGAYALLRFGYLQHLHNWTSNLNNWFPWLPDSAAIRGEHLARLGNHTEALTTFLELPTRGLPIFSDGLAYALDRLRLYTSLGGSHFEKAQLYQAQRLMEQLQRFATFTDFGQPLLTYTGIEPGNPSDEPLGEDITSFEGEEIHLQQIIVSSPSVIKKAIDEAGAFATPVNTMGVAVRFGVFLPGIEPKDGYEVLVRVIHKDDRFDPSIPPLDFHLTLEGDSTESLWQASVTIPVKPKTHFGQPGTYLYRYQLLQKLLSPPNTATTKIVTRWFTDPFARAADVGQLATFVTPGFVPDFPWTDETWKVPELDDLIVYELHVEEFNSTFDGIIERLPYLKSLGVNCLELMPVTRMKLDFDWGYGPLHYFAPNERWGGVQGLKRLVNACHHAGIAVILDVVYQHVDRTFPYCLVYENAGIESPMINGDGPFGPQIDFSKELAREYVRKVNSHWLYEYHVDGFRYDEVTELFDGPTGIKYARLAFDTYNESLKLSRFTPSGGVAAGEYSRIIQCPEALGLSQEILRSTYSNSTWQDDLLDKAESLIKGNSVDDRFVELLVLEKSSVDYPDTKTVHDSNYNPVEMPVAPFQYLENHDHSQLLCFTRTLLGDVPFGDRSKFYKLQPFVIALYTCQGIPMLWQGQEFAENYALPESGNGRIYFRRDVNWEYFYDDFGAPLIRLYRTLGNLRRTSPALRSRESFYYKSQSRPGDGIVAYSRGSICTEQIAMVFLNFSDGAQSISVPFPESGIYREMIDNDVRTIPFEIGVDHTLPALSINVPSHYGYVFIKG